MIFALAPKIIESSIEPSSYANKTETLEGYCRADDFDTEIITYFWTWYMNGEVHSEGEREYTSGSLINVDDITEEETEAYGDEWVLSCRAYDKKDYSAWLNSSITTILNTSEMWSYYYGNLTAKKVLGSGEQDIVSWDVQDFSDSYVFVTDRYSSISWLNLTALGTDDEVGCCMDDFDTLDELLGLTYSSNSMNRTFLEDGSPVNVSTFVINGQELSEVPIIGLNQNSSFVQGILWDAADDFGFNGYDDRDREDIIYFSPIYNDSSCSYGTCDFEIKVPYNLVFYETFGSVDTTYLYMYFEIN